MTSNKQQEGLDQGTRGGWGEQPPPQSTPPRNLFSAAIHRPNTGKSGTRRLSGETVRLIGATYLRVILAKSYKPTGAASPVQPVQPERVGYLFLAIAAVMARHPEWVTLFHYIPTLIAYRTYPTGRFTAQLQPTLAQGALVTPQDEVHRQVAKWPLVNALLCNCNARMGDKPSPSVAS